MTFVANTPAACLNVDHRYEERDRIRKEFAPHGICVEFFGCGQGKRFRPSWYDRVDTAPPPRSGYPAWASRPNSWNAFQCFRVIVGLAGFRRWDRVLLLEDDVGLEPHFGEVFEKGLADVERVDPDWQFLYLSANHTFRPTEEVTPNLLRLAGSGGFHCVLLHRRAFELVLNLPQAAPIDEMVGQCLHPLGHSYAIWPQGAYQRAGYSHCEGGFFDYQGQNLYKSKGVNHPA